MKKHTSILLTVMVLVLSFAFTGCNNGGTFTEKQYTALDSSIKAITINVADREISVSASDDNQFYIDYFESEKEFYEISVSQDNQLTMTLLTDKKLTDYIGVKAELKYRKINLKIPNSILDSLSIKTTNNDIKLSPLATIQNISISSNGGNLEFEKVNVGKQLSLTAKNGNIAGTIIGSYDVFSIACKIKQGKCNLPLEKAEGEKSLNANCNNGNIKIDFTKE